MFESGRRVFQSFHLLTASFSWARLGHAPAGVFVRNISFLAACCLFHSVAVAEGQKLAVVVGVNVYRAGSGLGPLQHAERDAALLSTVFREAGYNVHELTHQVSKEPGQERSAPGLGYIRDRIAGVLETPNLGDDDVIVIALSGHGVQLEFVEADGSKSPQYFFCPADATLQGAENANQVTANNFLLPLEELYDSLAKCKAGTKLLIIDACRNSPNQPGPFRTGTKTLTLPKLNPPKGGTLALFSCGPGQVSIEDPDLKQGVFTHFLVDGLRGSADQSFKDKPRDGIVTVSELVGYVADATYGYAIKKYQLKQTPEMKGEVILNYPLANCAPPLDGDKAGEQRTFSELKIKCRWCPDGDFVMGTPGSKDNDAAVMVSLSSGFWMGETEVTQRQWQTIMKSAPWKNQEFVKEGPDFAASYVCHGDTGAPKFEADSASEFCRRLTLQEHQLRRLPPDWRFALPTEAQWEYACRGASSTQFGLTPDSDDLKDYCWFIETADRIGELYAHEVGRKRPNAWGLSDMHGNVWEWCADGFSDTRPGGRDPLVEMKGSGRVRKGGGWSAEAIDCRSAARYEDSPATRGPDLGFRIAVVRSRTTVTK